MRSAWRRIPRAGRICFLIAFVNAAIWTMVVPPFQVPDEVAHFAYAQYVAQTGTPPRQSPTAAQYSPQEYAAISGLWFTSIIGHPTLRGIYTPSEQAGLEQALRSAHDPNGGGGLSSVTNQPPLYYALEAIPYWLSPSHNLLVRLELMRLLSALMAALTVLCIYMFMRELMPSTPWAWTVGALVAAFQPTFMFIASGVQGDNLLFLASAATFLALLRAWRHGLTRGRAAAIGLATVAGVLGKLTFITLVPGIALAVLWLMVRAWPRDRREALRSGAIAAVIVVAPVLLYALLNETVWHRGGPTAGGFVGTSNSASNTGGHVIGVRESLDYIWELYLPKLSFLNHRYFGTWPIWNLWFDGSIGHFGWLDYTFPASVYLDARHVFFAIGAFALAGFVRFGLPRVRPYLGLIVCYSAAAAGLLFAIGWNGLRYMESTGVPFEQARYLFPLLTFYALFVTLAARGAGRRYGPALGAVLVVLAMAHGLFAETLTISRYYG